MLLSRPPARKSIAPYDGSGGGFFSRDMDTIALPYFVMPMHVSQKPDKGVGAETGQAVHKQLFSEKVPPTFQSKWFACIPLTLNAEIVQ